MVFVTDLGILLLCLRDGGAEDAHVRALYGGLALYVFVYVAFSMATEYLQSSQEQPTGTWLDFAWSLPLLYGTYSAAAWQSGEGSSARVRLRRLSLAELLIKTACSLWRL